MPRNARIVLADIPYHVTHRGNNRQAIFLLDEDRPRYLRLLKQYADAQALSVLGYCLMSNHVHLVSIPRRASSLARAVGYTHLRYAQYANPRHGRCGHLWQGRFFACPLDEAHLVRALRYVERNPVRAGLAAFPEDFPWSSAGAHCGVAEDGFGLLDLCAWRTLWPDNAWQTYLHQPDDEEDIFRLRRWTNTGRPLGDGPFIERIEASLGYRVHPLPVGRPRKKQSENGK